MSLYDQLVALKPSIVRQDGKRRAILDHIGEGWKIHAKLIYGQLQTELENKKNIEWFYYVGQPFNMSQSFNMVDYISVLIELLKSTDDLKNFTFTPTPVINPVNQRQPGMYIKVSW